MKHLLLTTIAAVVLVGCVGVSKTELLKDEEGNLIIWPVEPVPEAVTPEPPTAKAPDISIHGAATFGNIEAINQHLAAGTDVNAKDDDGTTPLHGAAIHGHKEIAELLIAEGADVNAKAYGKTPLDFAVEHDKPETSDLLRKHGGKTKKELEAAAK